MKTTISGFSFIEVLVSLLILSMMLLGLDASEYFAVRENRNAYFFSIATLQLQSMVERLKTLGTATGLDNQILIWNNQNQTVLPQGRGYISGQFPTYTITLFWGNENGSAICEENHGDFSGCLHEQIKF